MCRSIKVLRDGVELASEEETRAAAVQFVRKVSGFTSPAPANREAFEVAIDEITETCRRLLGSLTVGGQPTIPHD